MGGGGAAATLISVVCERVMISSNLRESRRETEVERARGAHASQQRVHSPNSGNPKEEDK